MKVSHQERSSFVTDCPQAQQTHPFRSSIYVVVAAVPFAIVVDELWEERLLVLAEARQLKETATYWLHPEVPVTASTGARCYFDRISSPLVETEEEADEKNAVLEEVAALKKCAFMFQHPEAPVVVEDTTCSGRNYFTRPSAYSIMENASSVEECKLHGFS
jgi:hypothetical protein